MSLIPVKNKAFLAFLDNQLAFTIFIIFITVRAVESFFNTDVSFS